MSKLVLLANKLQFLKINKIILNSVFLSTAVLLIFSSCYKDSPGFQTAENGLKFQYLKENIQGKKPKTGDYVEIKLIYSNNKDSVLFNSNEISNTIKMRVDKPSHAACIEDAIAMLKMGDRVLFKISADSFFIKTKKVKIPNWVKKGDKLTFDIELISILNKEQVKKEQLTLKERRKKEEDDMISRYLKENNIKEESLISGLYYIEIQEGKGKLAKPDDVLLVHYTGKYIDGSLFDSSFDRNEPFMFQLGNAEVIAGWEEGFSKMKQSGKAKFIIPSHLAYGEKGYGKIIPPYSTLIFEVELVKIKE